MDESTLRLEIAKVFWREGFCWHHPPDMATIIGAKVEKSEEKKEGEKKTRLKREVGRIDLYLLNPAGPSTMLETKKIVMEDGPRMGHNGTLLFSEITDPQRATLDRWVYRLGGMGFLGLGTIDTTEKRRMWIIPWEEWVRVESQFLEDGWKGIPVHSSKRSGLDDFFTDFELEWVGGDIPWKLPPGHPVLGMCSSPHPDNEWEPVSARFPKA